MLIPSCSSRIAVPTSRPGIAGVCGAWAFLLAVGIFLAVPGMVQAQTADSVLISNTGQARSGFLRVDSGDDHLFSQRFTTGGSSAGYNLSSVGIRFRDISALAPNKTFMVHVYTTVGAGNLLYTLTSPAAFTTSRVNDFVAPAGAVLSANTVYALRVETTALSGVDMDATLLNSEDTGGARGWSIEDEYRVSGQLGEGNGGSMMLDIKGSAIDVPATVLVSNTELPGDFGISGVGKNFFPTNNTQLFTTGDNAHGYDLSSVGVKFEGIRASSGETITFYIYTTTASYEIDRLLYTLKTPAPLTRNSVNHFAAPPGAVLSANTDYTLALVATGNHINDFTIRLILSDEQDAALSGWSIEDQIRIGGFIVGGDSFQINVSGHVRSSPAESFAATGAPSITGSAVVGEVLTADTSGIMDADGLVGVSYAYQWLQVDGLVETRIRGATGRTYAVAFGDVGKRLKVRVTFTDDADVAEELTSVVTEAVEPEATLVSNRGALSTRMIAFGNHINPAILTQLFTTGDNAYGYDLSSVDVAFSAIDASPGETVTFRIYTTTASGAIDRLLYTLETPAPLLQGDSNFAAPPNAALSANTKYALSFTATADLAADFTIWGTHFDNETTALSGWSIENSIRSNGLRSGDGSAGIKIQGRVRNSPANVPATGAPWISGTVQEGEGLTVQTADIRDGNGVGRAVYSYQWLWVSGDAEIEIPGATGNTYIPTRGDVGKLLRVRVTFADDEGNEEELVSAVTRSVQQLVLVSNTGFGEGGVLGLTPFDGPPDDYSQLFTTGGNARGYELSSVGVAFDLVSNNSSKTVTLYIYTTKASKAIDQLVYTLETPAPLRQNRVNDFAAPPGAVLSANTEYALAASVNSQEDFFLSLIAEDGEDPALPGWSIENSDRFRGGVNSIHSWRITIRGRERDQARLNRPAIGAPQIAGRVQVGHTLTASMGSIEDPDGLSNVNYTYQWIRLVAGPDRFFEIPGATGRTYVPVVADEGKALAVRVSFTDDAGFAEEKMSVRTVPVVSVPTLVGNIGQVISFDARVGNVRAPTQYTQGFTTGSDADGYDLFSVGLRLFDFNGSAGETMVISLYEANNDGSLGTFQYSLRSPKRLVAAHHTVNEFLAPEGATLAPDTDYLLSFTGTGNSPYDVAIQLTSSEDQDTGGETDWEIEDEYRFNGQLVSDFPRADPHVIMMRVRGRPRSEPSSIPHNSPASGAVTVKGGQRAGMRVTASVDAITDDNGMDGVIYAYQWFRVDGGVEAEIPGATEQVYRLGSAEEGRQVRVRLSFRDDDGYVENSVSAVYPPGRMVRQSVDAGLGSLSVDEVGEMYVTKDGSLYVSLSGITSATESVMLRFTLSQADASCEVFYSQDDLQGNAALGLATELRGRAACTGPGEQALNVTLGPGHNYVAVLVRSAAGNQKRFIVALYREAEADYTLLEEGETRQGVRYSFPEASPGAPIRIVLSGDATVEEDYVLYSLEGSTPTRLTGPDYTVSVLAGGFVDLAAEAVDDARAEGREVFMVTLRWDGPAQPLQGSGVGGRSTSTDYAIVDDDAFATGAPQIMGEVRVDQTLTAGTSNIVDLDGLAGVSYEYQWIRVDGDVEDDIASATGATYTPVAEDVGKTLKVRVLFTDDAGNAEMLTSKETTTLARVLVSNLDRNVATGGRASDLKNQTQQFTTGSHLNGYDLISIGVRIGHGLIGGPTPLTLHLYTMTSIGELGDRLYTLTTPDPFRVGRAIYFVAPAGAALLAGTDYALVFTHTNSRDNAFGVSGTLSDGEDGLTGWGVADAYLDQGSSTSSGAAMMISVNGGERSSPVPNRPASGAPATTGTVKVGQTLTADTSAIVDADGLASVRYSYQWVRVDGNSETDIAGAPGRTYMLGSADEGKTLKVRVAFTDNRSNPETRTSAETAAVLPASTLVSNTGQSRHSAVLVVGDQGFSRAFTQSFTTGDHADGYSMSSIAVDLDPVAASGEETITFYLHRATPSGGLGHQVYALETPATLISGENVFAAPADAVLFEDTRYVLAFTTTGNSTFDFSLNRTASNAEDPMRASRWVIEDAVRFEGRLQINGLAFRIDVRGEARSSPIPPNNSASGVLGILGTTRVESTLTADTSGIMDSDGLVGVSYTYQWIRVDGGTGTEIPGATDRTYTLAALDEGNRLRVRVEFVDERTYLETLTSEATAGVSPARMAVDLVSNTGQAVGAFLGAGTSASLTDVAQVFTTGSHPSGYVLSSVGVRFAGASNDTTETITFYIHEVTQDGVFGNNLYTLETPTTLAVGVNDFAVSGDAFLSMSTPYALAYTSTGDNTTDFRLQRTVSDAEDSGSVAGWSIADAYGSGPNLHAPNSLSLMISVNGSLRAANEPASGAPTITGPTQVGLTLAADTSAIADANGLVSVSYAYQWIRVDGSEADIAGATSRTYEPVAADVGKTLKVRVAFTDDAGYSETRTSAATVEVTQAVTLVSNVGQPARLVEAVGRDRVPRVSQGFRTGTNTDGYDLGGVGVRFTLDSNLDENIHTITFYIYESNGGRLGNLRYTLTNLATLVSGAVNLFEAPAGATLAARTDYLLAVTSTGRYRPDFQIDLTPSDSEDSGGAAGWIIENSYRVDGDPSTGFNTAHSLNMRVLGRARTSPIPSVDLPASGAPAITGTAQVGLTLTADTSAIADANGLGSVSYSYQWIRVDGSAEADIAGATDRTYMLAAADEGKTLKVRVAFTDDAGFSEMLTSAATAVVVPLVLGPLVSNANQPPPTFTGSDLDVGALTMPSEITQWFTTGPNVHGYDLTSVGIRVVEDFFNSPETILLHIHRVMSNGDLGDRVYLLVTPAAFDTGMINDFAAPAGAVLSADTTYALAFTSTGDQIDDFIIGLVESDAEDAGTAPGWTIEDGFRRGRILEPVSSIVMSVEGEVRSGPISGNNPATGAPTVEGIAQVGRVLTADTGGIMDADGLGSVSYSYQWIRVDGNAEADIAGATDRTYMLAAADEGKTLKVRVAFTDDAGYSETRASVPTPTVMALGFVVSFDALEYTAVEGGRGATVTLEVDPTPTSQWVVPLTVTMQDGASIQDYSGVPTSLTFSPTRASWTFVVEATDDTVDDDGESVALSFGALPTGLMAGPASSATVILADDDVRGVLVSPVELTVLEGESENYAISLNSEPTGAVTVSVQGEDLAVLSAADIRMSPTTLTFTSANWAVAQTVTVTVRDDLNLVPEEDVVTSLEHGVSGADYAGELAAPVSVTVPGYELVQESDGTVQLLINIPSDGRVLVPEVPEPHSDAVPSGVQVSFPVSPASLAGTVVAFTTVTGGVALSDPPRGFRVGDLVVDISLKDGATLARQDATVCLPTDSRGLRVYHYGTDSIPSEWEILEEPSDGSPPGLACGVTQDLSLFTLGVAPEIVAAQAWLARFGRTVASHVATAVSDRLAMQPAETAQWTVGDLMSLDEQAILSGSSFALPLSEADGQRWTAWGKGAYMEFDGEEDGIELDGDVLAGTVGVDVEIGRWLAGLVVAHNEGDGEAHGGGVDNVEMDVSLTSAHPYLRVQVTDSLSLWGMLGYGEGDLELGPAEGRSEVDLEMRMGVAGLRGRLGAWQGMEISLMSELLTVRMETNEGNMLEIESDASQARVLLEGRGRQELASGGTLEPRAEIGARYDEGDAEEGLGVELGAGLRYAGERLTAESSVRGLLAHEESGYDEWGVSGALALAPGRAGRGAMLRLDSSYGMVASGTQELWSRRDVKGIASERAGLGARFEAELGYGLNAAGGRGVWTPYAGFSRQGEEDAWRLGSRLEVGDALELSFEGAWRRREDALDDRGLEFRLSGRW